jgi:hypothetical protein
MPLPHELYRDLVVKRVYTDKKGTALIPKQLYRLILYEELAAEYVYVNVEMDPSLIAHGFDKFALYKGVYNPISYLKGMVITNHGSSIIRNLGKPAEYAVYTTQHNWGTFIKDEESVTAKLERW